MIASMRDRKMSIAEKTRVFDDTPTWRDRPTLPGLYMCESLPDTIVPNEFVVLDLDQEDIDRGAPFATKRVYGPIER